MDLYDLLNNARGEIADLKEKLREQEIEIAALKKELSEYKKLNPYKLEA